MMDAKYLAEIKAREQAATKGPWVSVFDLKGFTIYDMSGDKGTIVARLLNTRRKYKQSDAAFITHARTDIPALIKQHEQDQQQIATLKESKEALENDLINANMNLEHAEQRNATLKNALELAEDMLTKMTPFKSKGGWHDRLIWQAQERNCRTCQKINGCPHRRFELDDYEPCAEYASRE